MPILAAPPRPQSHQIFDMTFSKQNAARDGFNLWTIMTMAFLQEKATMFPSEKAATTAFPSKRE